MIRYCVIPNQYNNKVKIVTTSPIGVEKGGGRFNDPCFRKVNDSYVSTIELPETLEEYTISLWCYFYGTGGWQLPVNQAWISGSKLFWYWSDTQYKDLPIQENKWIHFWISCNKFHQYVYVDGVEIKCEVPAAPLKSINFMSGGTSYPTFNGKISNIVIWDEAMPFSEIPTQPIGYYKMLYIDEDKKVFKVGD